MEEKKFCENCKYFWEFNLECRKKSPVHRGTLQDCFPRVTKKAWCGEWKTAQQSVQPTLESVRELPAVVIVSKSKQPAKSG